MNIKNYKKVFPYLLKANVSPFVWGEKGIGKTEIHRQLAEELGYNFIYLTFGAVEDVGDIIGLLTEVKDENGKVIEVKHARPSWFPTTPKNIIFLDEFNRARKPIIQAMLPFILEGRLHTHQLPEDSFIVMAGNPPTDDYQTTDISDKALLSRACHLHLEPTPKEWLSYCATTGTHPDVISFIQENPEMLKVESKEKWTVDFAEPSGRSWKEFVSRLISEDTPEIYMTEILKGLIGTVAAVKFLKYRKTHGFRVKGSEILNSYSVVRDEIVKNLDRVDILNIVSEEIIREIEILKTIDKKQCGNIKKFLKDTPIEFSYSMSRELMKLGCKNLSKFIGEDRDLIDLYENKLNEIRSEAI